MNINNEYLFDIDIISKIKKMILSLGKIKKWD